MDKPGAQRETEAGNVALGCISLELVFKDFGREDLCQGECLERRELRTVPRGTRKKALERQKEKSQLKKTDAGQPGDQKSSAGRRGTLKEGAASLSYNAERSRPLRTEM